MNGEIQPSHLLIAMLCAVALAGILVGWFARRILAVSEINKVIESNKQRMGELESSVSKLEKELGDSQSKVREFDQMVSENQRLMVEVDGYDKEKDEIAQLLARREKRIKTLESQVVQAEEQYVRGQKDFAKMRLMKAREVQRLQQQVENLIHPEASTAAEDDLPVLFKKAGSTQSATRAANVSSQTSTPSRNVIAPGGQSAVAATSLESLPDITHANLDSGEDVFEMTSEFDFDPEELLVPPDADKG